MSKYLLLLVFFALQGCIPPGHLLVNRDIQKLEVGYSADGSKENLLLTDKDVDALSFELAIFLNSKGMELLSSSDSWEIQPLRGHAKNMDFRYPGKDYLYLFIKISKAEFEAVFVEVEKESNTNIFLTTEKDIKDIGMIVESLRSFARSKFAKRAIKVSFYDYVYVPHR
ncbi:MAG: hypothetical protein CSA34_06800 [Desulfobulbus propionicus]|nr:MAG: hypothetical protein CSA34_06800 [Desulfobulbus propionicus]